MSDWNAAEYHKLSDPQREWGLRVLDRLGPRDGERILDIGCGTGRLTAAMAAQAALAQIVATDRSGAMLREARAHFAADAVFVQADGARLPFCADRSMRSSAPRLFTGLPIMRRCSQRFTGS